MTPIQLSVSILMVAVAVAVLVWLRTSMSAASQRRRMAMIGRVGLDPAIAASDDPATRATMDGTRRRCTKCMHEAHCERWLAGEAEGSNAFCPNARVFDHILDTRAHAV